MKKLITKSTLAGVLIASAGAIFLKCENKIIGSMLFSIGLYAVCVFQAKLFTGVIGNVNSLHTLIEDCVILLVNMSTAALFGLLYRLAIGENQVFNDIVSNQTWYRVLFESCLCGVLIYIAVTIYKNTDNPLALVLCVMAFILSGSLHSIACSFYIVLGEVTWQSIVYLLLIILGNSIGAITVRLLCDKTINN